MLAAAAIVAVSLLAYVAAQGTGVSIPADSITGPITATSLQSRTPSDFLAAKQADGSIKVGSYTSKPGCSADIKGTLIFDSAESKLYVCSAAEWQAVS